MSYFPPGAMTGWLLLMYMWSLLSTTDSKWSSIHFWLCPASWYSALAQVVLLPLYMKINWSGIYSGCDGNPKGSRRGLHLNPLLSREVHWPQSWLYWYLCLHQAAIPQNCHCSGLWLGDATIYPLATSLTNSSLLSGWCNLIKNIISIVGKTFKKL